MPPRPDEPYPIAKSLAVTILAALLEELRTHPVPDHAPAYLAGLFTWDLFSNNHEVISPAGRVANIGSWRGAGSSIGELLHDTAGVEESYGYLDFYMGSSYVDGLTDGVCQPYLRVAFERLRALGADWHYAFPETGLVAFDRPATPPDAADYDPAKAAAEELARQQREAELAALRQLLREDLEQRKEDALYRPPPGIVRAYAEVYKRFPAGWIQ